MNRSRSVYRAIVLLATMFVSLAGRCGADETRTSKSTPPNLSEKDVRWMFEKVELIDPTKKDLLDHIHRFRPNQRVYTAEDVSAVLGTLPKVKFPYSPPSPPVPSTAGALSKDDSVRLLQMLNGLAPKKTRAQIVAELEAQFKHKSKEDVILALAATQQAASDPAADLVTKYGDKKYYAPTEVGDVRTNGAKPAMEDAPVPNPPPRGFLPPIEYGLTHPLIRKSWSDVVMGEDLSQSDSARTKVTDLVGATFSYSSNDRSRTETWNAVGALIVPFDYRLPVKGGLTPDEFMVAPSVSINRISTNGDPKTEANQLFFRVGLFLNWEEHFGAVQLRTAFVYGTDTGFRTSLPAIEADLEAQFDWRPAGAAASGTTDFASRYLKIGYQNILIPRTTSALQTDNSFLDYQLRLYLHMEGGDLQRASAVYNAVDGTFFRVGPAAQLTVNAPRLVFGHPLAFTGTYKYYPSISGTPEHNRQLSMDLTLGLIPLNQPKDVSLQRKISLNLDYTAGGLDLTKQDVRQLTVGLSVLY